MLKVGGPLASALTRSELLRALVLRDAMARPERVKSAEAKLLIEHAAARGRVRLLGIFDALLPSRRLRDVIARWVP